MVDPLPTAPERRRRLRRLGTALAAAIALVASVLAGGAPAQALTGDLRVHDPSILKVGSCYYVYSTGLGGGPGNGSIQIRKSCDTNGRTGWTFVGTMFNSVPAWITQYFGETPPSLWAPDINLVGGKYYLYYAAAIWGKKPAVTGLATSSSPTGPWTDQGMVTDYNAAIDPNVAYSGSTPYVFYGGFAGVNVQQMNPSTGKLTGARTAIAQRIENSSIAYNGGYYYLFGSKGGCCNGVNSTYYTVVARSTSLTGPYVDKSGVQMNSGGGTRILDSGGADVFQDGSSLKLAYHYYDPNNNGLERLDIRPLTFSGGWPVVGTPIGP